MSKFIDRSCPDPPPEPWLGIDVDWPKKSSKRGSVLTYTCPYKKMTHVEFITGKITQFDTVTSTISAL